MLASRTLVLLSCLGVTACTPLATTTGDAPGGDALSDPATDFVYLGVKSFSLETGLEGGGTLVFDKLPEGKHVFVIDFLKKDTLAYEAKLGTFFRIGPGRADFDYSNNIAWVGGTDATPLPAIAASCMKAACALDRLPGNEKLAYDESSFGSVQFSMDDKDRALRIVLRPTEALDGNKLKIELTPIDARPKPPTEPTPPTPITVPTDFVYLGRIDASRGSVTQTFTSLPAGRHLFVFDLVHADTTEFTSQIAANFRIGPNNADIDFDSSIATTIGTDASPLVAIPVACTVGAPCPIAQLPGASALTFANALIGIDWKFSADERVDRFYANPSAAIVGDLRITQSCQSGCQ